MPSDDASSKPLLNNVNFIARVQAFAGGDANRLRELAKVNSNWKEAICSWNGGRTETALFDEALKTSYLRDDVFFDDKTTNVESLIRFNPFARKSQFLLVDLKEAPLSPNPKVDNDFSRYKLHFMPDAFCQQFDVLSRYASQGEYEGRGATLEEVKRALTASDHHFFVATASVGYSNILQSLVGLYMHVDPSGALLRSAISSSPEKCSTAIHEASGAKNECHQTMAVLFNAYQLLENSKKALADGLRCIPHNCHSPLFRVAGRQSLDTAVPIVAAMYSAADPSGTLLREGLEQYDCTCLMEAIGSGSLANLTSVLNLYRGQGSDFLKQALTVGAEGPEEIYDAYGAIELAQENGNAEIVTELLKAYQESDLLQEAKTCLRPENDNLLKQIETSAAVSPSVPSPKKA